MLQITKYYTPTCGPCKLVDQILKDLKEELDFEITPIDATTLTRDELHEHSVSRVPTLHFYRDGLLEKVISGTRTPKEFRLIIEALT
jgi:thiol-disulfide isomerase/thioredoxin